MRYAHEMLLLALISVAVDAPDACGDAIPDDAWFANRIDSALILHKSMLQIARASGDSEILRSTNEIVGQGDHFVSTMAHLSNLAELSRVKQVRRRALEMFKAVLTGDPLHFRSMLINARLARLHFEVIQPNSAAYSASRLMAHVCRWLASGPR